MTIVTTPAAPHPKAQVLRIDLEAGSISFRWLNEDDEPVDTGGSVASYTPGANVPTTTQVRAAIEATTS